MVKAAVAVSGDGAEMQSLLDGMFFGEIPGFTLAAVVATESGSYALERSGSLRIPGYVVDAHIFPNAATFTRALTTKLTDLDVDISILVGLSPEPDEPLYRAFSGRCICLRLARDAASLTATALLADADGSEARRFGRISVDAAPGEDDAALRRRLVESGSGELLTDAVRKYMRDFH